MGFNCLKPTEPLRRDSLLFTAKFLEGSGTYLIDLVRIKKGCEPTLEQSPSGFEPRATRFGIQCPNHWAIATWTQTRWKPINSYQKKNYIAHYFHNAWFSWSFKYTWQTPLTRWTEISFSLISHFPL